MTLLFPLLQKQLNHLHTVAHNSTYKPSQSEWKSPWGFQLDLPFWEPQPTDLAWWHIRTETSEWVDKTFIEFLGPRERVASLAGWLAPHSCSVNTGVCWAEVWAALICGVRDKAPLIQTSPSTGHCEDTCQHTPNWSPPMQKNFGATVQWTFVKICEQEIRTFPSGDSL